MTGMTRKFIFKLVGGYDFLSPWDLIIGNLKFSFSLIPNLIDNPEKISYAMPENLAS